MFLSIFIHSFHFFKTTIQSFYIALSQNNIRTRNKMAADLLIIRGRINYTRGRGQPKIFEKVSQCRKMCQRHPIPYLNTCITYLNTLTRLHILIHALPILIY